MDTLERSIENITLDWDNYCYPNIEKDQANIFRFMKDIAENITIYESQKGLNINIKLKNPVHLMEHFFVRALLYDDLFRQRNDVRKYWLGQYYRINRIWLVKNGIEKRLIFTGKSDQMTLSVFTDCLELLKSKLKQKKDGEE